MRIGDLVMLDHPYGFYHGLIGIIFSKKIYFSDQKTFSIMWSDGKIDDGWVNGSSMIKVIS